MLPVSQPFPNSSWQPIPIYRGRLMAQSRVSEDSGAHQPREGGLLAPTCLWTQQLPGQYGPRALLLSCVALHPG